MTLSDEINNMIKKILESSVWTSSGGDSPKENFIREVRGIENVDLESILREGGDDTEATKEQKKTDEIIKTVEGWDRGTVGDISRFTSSQVSNLKGFVDNPVNFIVQSVLGKFARGAGVAALGLVIFEAVKWIIGELLKPGRLLDRRFKRDIRDEIIAFRRREDQQRLKQGFSNIIITTTPRLRLGQNQAVNTLDFAAGRGVFPDNIGQSAVLLEASGVSVSKAKGAGRRRFGGPGS